VAANLPQTRTGEAYIPSKSGTRCWSINGLPERILTGPDHVVDYIQ
jgi:hypothetical protein